VDGRGYSWSGEEDREEYKPELRDELFSVTLTAKGN
jgi:hypothetical protein